MQSKIAPWAFVLAVPDINRSAQYFHDVLGFHVSWQDATDWRLVERDGVRIMLGQCPTDIHPSALGSHNWFGYRRLARGIYGARGDLLCPERYSLRNAGDHCNHNRRA